MLSAKKSKSKTGPAASAFDESALSALTAKLESNLPQSKPAQHIGKRKRETTYNVRDGGQPRQDINGKKLLNGKTRPAKRSGKPAPTSLLDEIRLLGGDEADLDLVTGIDSDAEDGGDTKSKPNASSISEKALQKELSQFAASLGFEKVRDEDAVSGEEDDSVVEDDEDYGKDEEEELAPQAPVVQPLEPQRSRSGGKLMFEPRSDWHVASSEGLSSPRVDDIRNFNSAIHSLKAHAETLLEQDTAAYAKTVASSPTRKFMTTIMSSGTMSDKVSALTLAVQESPVHNRKALESLINLAGKNSRSQAISALGALIDLLANGSMLPNDRRLRAFAAQPGLLATLQQSDNSFWRPGQPLPGGLQDSHLIAWTYEEWLKDAFFKIVQLLEKWSNDEIEHSRSRALDFIFGLLKDKPEQEANLLRLLVNRFSDREKKVASRASYLLLQLLNQHPGMKPIVINALENEILLRPGSSLRTKYYAINTLNQTILSNNEPQVADNLIRIYFELFASLLKSGAMGEPGADDSTQHSGNANQPNGPKKGKPAESTESDSSERLVSAVLTGVNRAVPFSNTDEGTLERHLDTLFRISHSSNFNTAVQALMLIQQLSVSRYVAVDRFYRTLYDSLLDPRLVTSSKQALYLNLLYRSLKNDVDIKRVKAFVKRMLQTVYLHQVPFACGILFLVSELQKTFSSLSTMLNDPEQHEDDQEEVFHDAPDETMKDVTAVAPTTSTDAQSAYDGRKRDPQYSNADQTCLWELIPYFNHFHPSVAVFASNILERQKNLPKPELANHTLIHFLDRFVYRNAKATDGKKGSSIMQPVLAAGNAANIVTPGKAGAVKDQGSVNSALFWNLKPENVAAEDVFFHKYFAQVGKQGQAGKKAKAKKQAEVDAFDGDSDDEGAADDLNEDEDEIWDALVKSRPDVGGEDEDEEGFDISDDESNLGSLLDMSDSDDSMASGDDDDGGVDVEGSDLDEEDAGWVDGADLDDQMDADDNEDDDRVDAEKEANGKTAKATTNAKKLRRKELKALPMFATADDYAEMLADEDDGI